MKDNSNWNLRFNRSSKQFLGYSLKSKDFKRGSYPYFVSEGEFCLVIAVLIVLSGVLGAIFF